MALVYCVALDCIFHDGVCDCRLLQVDIDWLGGCAHYKTFEDFLDGFTIEEAKALVENIENLPQAQKDIN